MTPPVNSGPYDAGVSLGLAVVALSTAPLVLLDNDLTIAAASSSFCTAFGLDPTEVNGRSLFDLGKGEWNLARLRSLLAATVSGDAEIANYEMDLQRPGQDDRTLILRAQRIVYGDIHHPRLLLSIADVTEAQAAERLREDLLLQKDALLRDNVLLLKKVRHRVANSLQIIASVLLQNARRTQSEETRAHLHDAHNRVMSIAELERQLAVSDLSDVRISLYFGKLCDSIRASMITDPEMLRLSVESDDSMIDADSSVSLGLIVTELVINALKHAFPVTGAGSIIVGFQGDLPSWVLSITDDGVGMPSGARKAKAGLGTTIVEALATQLDATVSAVSANPGTRVAIVHAQLAGASARTPPVAAL